MVSVFLIVAHCVQFLPKSPAELINTLRPGTIERGDILLGIDGISISA